MSEYQWNRVSSDITFTKPTTVTRWVWFWQTGWFKTHGWKVSDKTLLKRQVWREMRLDDYIYGDGASAPIGLAALYSDGTKTGLGIEPNKFWKR